MDKGIFITATGTDVGKTYVSALLVKNLKDAGINCGYYKPALSGAEIINGELVPGDCAYVKKIAGLEEPAMNYLSYCFKPAVSPHLASQIENNPIKLDKIKSDFDTIKRRYDYVVVEGAGGIVCPMDLSSERPFLTEHIIKALGLDVVVVAPAELGSINSAVTTVEYARSHGINVRGIILNKYDDNDYMQRDNKKQIEYLCNVPVIASVVSGASNLIIDKSCLL
ncbi:dethiobiotin synthase [bacterium]|nr:dethiobiotin synthase [bacterium]